MKVLLIRMDRLGDLICTLPVDQITSERNGDSYEFQWIVSRGLEPVMQMAKPVRYYRSFGVPFDLQQFRELTQWLRSSVFDKVVLFYAPWWVALACWVARIPERYSPRSRWFHFFFFNRTLRQSRSRSEKHEADYNWELMRWALGLPSSMNPKADKTPTLEFQVDLADAKKKLKLNALPENYVVLHPGMGGSALNWSASSYLELAKRLVESGKSVVVTGTRSDLPWLKDLKDPIKSLKNIYWMVDHFDLKTLIYVLGQSDAVVAPSTGVVHLAASTGVRTIGLYSPIRVQTPTRWGPRGRQVKALVPDVTCPASRRCLGARCAHYACLEKIQPEEVLCEVLLSEDL